MSPASRFDGAPNAREARAAFERLAPWAEKRGWAERLAREAACAADPATALVNLETLIASGWEIDEDLLAPLLAIVGASQALASTIGSSPELDAPALRRLLATDVVTPAEHVAGVAARVDGDFGRADVPACLRRHKRREVLRIGARDLLRRGSVPQTVRELSALAEGASEVALRYARAQVAKDFGEFGAGDPLRFVVLAMGKLGGAELNFSSDVDLVYLFDGGRQPSPGARRPGVAGLVYATRIAEILTKTLSEVGDEGFVFRVDLRLRPDGQNGPIVNSLAAAMVYYESFGQTWERAAMLKARPIAGDVGLGRTFLEEIGPFVYRRFLDFDTVGDIEEMKAKVDSSQSRARLDRDVKLGPGGIREVEFIAQASQLVHGGRDPRLRTRATLDTLRAMAEVGLIDAGEESELSRAYLFLRDVEHKLQIVHERQTQRLPTEPLEEQLLARRLGYHLEAADDGGSAEVPVEVLRLRADLESHRRRVRRSFEQLFIGPRAEIRKQTDEAAADLLGSLEDRPAAEARLASMGFADPAAALAHLLRLRDGPRFSPASPRRQKALYALAPALLGAIRSASDPDLALLHMAEFVSAIGARTSFLALLGQNPETMRLLVGLFGTSRYLSSFFLRHPELLDSLVRADVAIVRKDRARLEAALASSLDSATDYETRLDALRRFHNEELLRIGVNDIHGLLEAVEVEMDLSLLAEVCLQGALRIAAAALPYGEEPGRFAVLGLGKLGRRELSYNSDLDLIFVYDGPVDGAARLSPREYYTKLAQRLISVLSITTREGYAYKIDMRLRPSGSNGLLVSSLEAFREYHRTSSALWERQAMISARGVAGDGSLVDAVESVSEGFVYGAPIGDDDVAEIGRVRARMEAELARETATHWDLKTGRGGIVDVEFVTEMLRLRHGKEHPKVRRRRTEDALDALLAEGLLEARHHRTLLDGYRFLRRVESRLRIWRDQALHTLDLEDPTLASLARRLGYEGADARSRLLDDVGRVRDRIRAVYDEQFSR